MRQGRVAGAGFLKPQLLTKKSSHSLGGRGDGGESRAGEGERFRRMRQEGWKREGRASVSLDPAGDTIWVDRKGC